MKKIVLLLAALFSTMSIVVSCSGNAGDRQEESIPQADSVRATEGSRGMVFQRRPTNYYIYNAEAVDLYKSAISIEPGKKAEKKVPKQSFYEIDWTCTVTNNTPVTFFPDDYEIVYKETYEARDKSGGLTKLTKIRSEKGPELAPGASVEVVLSGKDATLDLSMPAVKIKMPEEDFIKKYISIKNAR